MIHIARISSNTSLGTGVHVPSDIEAAAVTKNIGTEVIAVPSATRWTMEPAASGGQARRRGIVTAASPYWTRQMKVQYPTRAPGSKSWETQAPTPGSAGPNNTPTQNGKA